MFVHIGLIEMFQIITVKKIILHASFINDLNALTAEISQLSWPPHAGVTGLKQYERIQPAKWCLQLTALNPAGNGT